jgi:hypothetical protein
MHNSATEDHGGGQSAHIDCELQKIVLPPGDPPTIATGCNRLATRSSKSTIFNGLLATNIALSPPQFRWVLSGSHPIR